MYFIDEDGNVHHATIISTVTNDAIAYSRNTKRRFDYSLEQSLEDGEYGVYIVRIKDQIEAVSEENQCGE